MADDKVAIWGSGLKFGRKPANGELLIGNGDDMTLATLTAGSGVTVTNAAGAVTISATGIVGALDVPSGGTGQSSLTANNVILGNGASPVQFVAPGANGNVLTSNGTTWTSAAVTNEIPSQTGNDGKFLTTNGTSASWASTISRGTVVAATSGTVIDFTGIPSWVKRITVILQGVSTNGTSNLLVRVGSGTYETSGYSGGCNMFSSTATTGGTIPVGFPFELVTYVDATSVRHGIMTITNITGNTWVSASTMGCSAGTQISAVGAGSISLSGTLDRVRLTTSGGTNTFDAGNVNIFWE